MPNDTTNYNPQLIELTIPFTETLALLGGEVVVADAGDIRVHLWRTAQWQRACDAFVGALRAKHPTRRIAVLDMSPERVASALAAGQPLGDHGNFTTTIDLCEFSPPSLIATLPEAHRPAFAAFMRTLFGAATAPGSTFIQLRLPSEAAAGDSGLSVAEYQRYWQALAAVDYGDLREACDEAMKSVSGRQALEVETKDLSGNVHQLTFAVGERPWHRDDGNGDFPAGEIYVAPLEDSVEGSFAAGRFFWEGTWYPEAVLTFKAGRLVASAPEVILADLAQAPGDALMFAEFGIGINPGLNPTLNPGLNSCLTSGLTSGLKQLSGHSLFDEKLAGTCHVALGANDMFGGGNGGPVHVDFVATQFHLITK